MSYGQIAKDKSYMFLNPYHRALRHNTEIFLIRCYVEKFVRVIGVFGYGQESAKAVLTDRKDKVILEIGRGVVWSAPLNAAIFTIFEV